MYVVLCKTLEKGEPRALGEIKRYMERKCIPVVISRISGLIRKNIEIAVLHIIFTERCLDRLHEGKSFTAEHPETNGREAARKGESERELMNLGNGFQQQGGVSGSESSERQ